jgi:hypothetical protein
MKKQLHFSKALLLLFLVCFTPRHLLTVDYAYVTAGDRSFEIEVSTPPQPLRIGTLMPFVDTEGAAVSGNYAYVADDSGNFFVIDVSVPTTPLMIGTLMDFGNPDRIAVNGNYVYLTDYQNGNFFVVDVSTPTNPSIISTIHFGKESLGVAVSGNSVYVANEDNYFAIDVSTPNRPVILAKMSNFGNRLGIAAKQELCLYSRQSKRQRLYDRSSAPSSPK